MVGAGTRSCSRTLEEVQHNLIQVSTKIHAYIGVRLGGAVIRNIQDAAHSIEAETCGRGMSRKRALGHANRGRAIESLDSHQVLPRGAKAIIHVLNRQRPVCQVDQCREGDGQRGVVEKR